MRLHLLIIVALATCLTSALPTPGLPSINQGPPKQQPQQARQPYSQQASPPHTTPRRQKSSRISPQHEISDNSPRPQLPGFSGRHPQEAAIDFDPNINYFPLDPMEYDTPDGKSLPAPELRQVSGGTEIPESEIRNEFPEFKEPRTFSTERVDYTLRTNSNPTPLVKANPNTLGVDNRALGYNGGPDAEPDGEFPPVKEENTNVAVFSDDKVFNWSSDKGEPLPRSDPAFRDALGWIGKKFRGEKDGSGKKRRGKAVVNPANSIFGVLLEHAA